MFLKYKFWMAVILSSLFFSGVANALNLRELLSGIAADVTVVTKQGSCAANPFSNDAPCLPTKVTCPVGKVPIPMKKMIPFCTSAATEPAEFDITKKITLTTATTAGSGSVSCNPKSNYYFVQLTTSPWYVNYTPRVGYSPLCNPVTKVCNIFNYTVTAHCVTSPDASVIKKLGVKTK